MFFFGVGGVGSWCAESLVRSGIRKMKIVDSDRVCVTNVNRQLMATTKTVGQVKVDALKERLLTINPSAEKPIDPDDKGNGSIVHITAIFGFMLAGLVVQDAVNQ